VLFRSYVSTNDPRAATDYAEGRKNGYFVKLEDGTEFDTLMISAGPQTVATIDMTNPGAVKWYGTILQRALDLGYDGFMLDFGEYLPPHAKMFDGTLGWAAHNSFPLAYQKATWDYMVKAKGNDFHFFARSGYAGTQQFITTHWSGDPDASFDDAKGLPAQVRAGINAGISGIPLWGSDMTGYTCLNNPPADKEVFVRWIEFGALSPEMHEENACSGTMPQQKWTAWSDAETTKIYGDYSVLHTRLFPYLYAQAKAATDSGVPIMRHAFLEHPLSADSYSVDLDYYFGDFLYVAPVVRRGATTRDVWLPPGKWIDWWTLDVLSSGHTTRSAPLATLPLFLKSGGVVPMLDASIQTLAPATDPQVVTLDKVSGVLDVRAAIDASVAKGSIALVDGSRFDIALGAGDVVLPSTITPAQEADLQMCSACGRVDPLQNGAKRVRITSSDATISAGALTLARTNGPGGTGARIRWDVVVLF